MSGHKRKRTKNTTTEQYELYLSCMENDYPFRSGALNPPDYVEKKWEELTIKLNALGDGPNLTIDEWKKRFGDWKYSTRSKYRKLQKKSDDVKLSALEERGMIVWGSKINYNGIETNSNQNVDHEMLSDNDLFSYDPNSDLSNGEMIEIHVNPAEVNTTQLHYLPKHEDTSKRKKDQMNGEHQTESNHGDLNNIIKSFYERYIDVELEKIKLKKAKLAFEIAKYKFENKHFKFDL